jgi:glycosyltransferase involved in cell wall biosynthesis
MTICIATDGFYPKVGGISTFYKHLTDLLVEAGHRVLVLTISDDEKEAENSDTIQQTETVTVVTLKKTFFSQLNHYRKYFRPGGYEVYQWIAIGHAMKMWLQTNCKTQGIDIVEVTDYGGIGFFLCESGLPPLAITAHGSLVQYANYNYTGEDEQVQLIKKLETEAFHSADVIIAHSPLNAEDLSQRTGTPVLFSTAPWKQLAEDVSADSENYFLIIGGMQVVKGAITMAQAIQVAAEKDPSIRVQWIGQDFYVAPRLEAMSSYLQRNFPAIWNQQFLWLGEQERSTTRHALKKSAAVIIPSDWETFNYVTLEASSLQKPMIISDGAGAVYLFNHEENALIVPAKDSLALASAMLKLKAAPSQATSLGKKANQKIIEHFQPGRIVGERIAIFEKIIRNPKIRKQGIEQRGSFLRTYLTIYRKQYYQARSLAKKIIEGRR